ncbi:MAG TPA: TerC family protein [Anaeromyxobacteraceae bacterium]|nr:TerC family protein [Anaeromyxobacteraceae bacterium]
MLELVTRSETWVALGTLSAMEIVLGIDNIVFLTILAARVPASQQPLARRLGLGFALLTRLGLLFAITWVMGLTRELFTLFGRAVSGRDLVLFSGGLFLIGKATYEIHDKLEVRHEEAPNAPRARSVLWTVIAQIAVLDIVFSLDSVITAVGMARHVAIMVAAMVIAVGVMLLFAGPIGTFVERHPTVKMLALSFLVLIGVVLVAEALGHHIEKGYIYFAMAFSLLVELLNLRARKSREPILLHHRFEEETTKRQGPGPGTAGASS